MQFITIFLCIFYTHSRVIYIQIITIHLWVFLYEHLGDLYIYMYISNILYLARAIFDIAGFVFLCSVLISRKAQVSVTAFLGVTFVLAIFQISE